MVKYRFAGGRGSGNDKVPERFPQWKAGEVLKARPGWGIAIWCPQKDEFVGTCHDDENKTELIVMIDGIDDHRSHPKHGLMWGVISHGGEVGWLSFDLRGMSVLHDPIELLERIP